MNLTRRQAEVWERREAGMLLKQIASALGIEVTTVMSHLERARAKLEKEAAP